MVANEWLDNIPCHVVEVDARRACARVVHVDPATGEESLGQPLDHSHGAGVAGRLAATRGGRSTPASRAPAPRSGTSRDAAWADVVGRVTRGIAVAVDYGHTRDGPAAVRVAAVLPRRARGGRAAGRVARRHRARRGGRGGRPRSAARCCRQRDALRELGVDGARPDLELATSDPAGYVRALAAATEAAELTAEGGLGDFLGVRWRVRTAQGLTTGTGTPRTAPGARRPAAGSPARGPPSGR